MREHTPTRLEVVIGCTTSWMKHYGRLSFTMLAATRPQFHIPPPSDLLANQIFALSMSRHAKTRRHSVTFRKSEVHRINGLALAGTRRNDRQRLRFPLALPNFHRLTVVR